MTLSGDGGSVSDRRLVTATPQTLALHRNFCNAIGGLKRELVRSIFYLREIADRRVYRMLGFDTIADYAAAASGLSPNQCRAFLRIGRKLKNLPAMRAALEDGSISWRKAYLIIGQAGPDSEGELIQAAARMGERQLRRHLAGRPVDPKLIESGDVPFPSGSGGPYPGSPPNEGKRRTLERSDGTKPLVLPERTEATPCEKEQAGAADEVQHVLFKFTPEQYVSWLALTGRHLARTKEERLIRALDNASAPGPEQSAAEPDYLIVIQLCPECERAVHGTARGVFEVSRSLLETARCDAVIEDETARRRRSIPPRLRREVLKRDGYRCQARGRQNSRSLQLHHRVPVARGGKDGSGKSGDALPGVPSPAARTGRGAAKGESRDLI